MSDQRIYLDRSAILAIPDLQTEDLFIPEWGAYVRVRGLTARERDEWEDSCLTQKGKNTTINVRNLRTKLVVRTVVDEDGQRIFSNGDAEALGEKSGAAVDRIYEVATRLSGVSERDAEELAGNSGTGQDAGSPSA